jgi:hypothetical protein
LAPEGLHLLTSGERTGENGGIVRDIMVRDGKSGGKKGDGRSVEHANAESAYLIPSSG